MRIGIIGLPQSGKTTIFNALTHGNQPVISAGGRFEMHTAVVEVPDQRVNLLSSMFQPQKTTYARITYVDLAGLEGSASKGEISGPLLNQLSQLDGFVQVVRCFENSRVPLPAGDLDPLRDLAALQGEMILNDSIAVERKLERLAEEQRRAGGREKGSAEREIDLFERLQGRLAAEQPLRNLELSAEEQKLISGFGFLTRKPVLILFNTSEGQTIPCVDYPGGRCEVVALQGKLEMDLAQLSPEDEQLFMAEYGIVESGLQQVINQTYCLMDLQSFFTVGEDEVRAWTVKAGATAWEAAGAIHSDLQKGFIRVEVVSYEDLDELGGLAEARKRGKLRLEGKDYLVQNGDIVHVRFNI
jgi:GTP-binding protein YchF